MADGKAPRGRPPERVTVIVNFKLALATPPEIETVVWPKGWPFPQVGDQITIGERNGFVTHLKFEPVANRLTVNTR